MVGRFDYFNAWVHELVLEARVDRSGVAKRIEAVEAQVDRVAQVAHHIVRTQEATGEDDEFYDDLEERQAELERRSQVSRPWLRRG